jgi:hypothetical protein
MYKNKIENNTFSVNSNLKGFTVSFPLMKSQYDDKLIVNDNKWVYTLPKLKKRHTTIEFSSENYETQRIEIGKTIRPIPFLMDITFSVFTFGIPIIIDLFKSDLYKINDTSKNIKIDFMYKQSYMFSEFNKIKDSKNPSSFDFFLDQFPTFENIDIVLNAKDSAEFNVALSQNTESAITEFIKSHPLSINLTKAIKIQEQFVKNRTDYNLVKSQNTVEAYEKFILDHPDAIQLNEAHLLLVETAEKKAFESKNALELISYQNNYLESNKRYLNNSSFDLKKSRVKNEITLNLNSDLINTDYDGYKSYWAKYNNIFKFNINNEDLNLYSSLFKKQLSTFLFSKLTKLNSESDQEKLIKSINNDFPKVYIYENLILELLDLSENKNGKIKIFNTNYLGHIFKTPSLKQKYNNAISDSYTYKSVNYLNLDSVEHQVLNFKNNLLDSTQQSGFKNEINYEVIITNSNIIQENFNKNNKTIVRIFYNSDLSSYIYEYDNNINLTLQKFDSDIKNIDNLFSQKKIEEALEGYKKLANNNLPKDIIQNKGLNIKLDVCQKAKDTKDKLAQQLEDKKQEKNKALELKKEEQNRITQSVQMRKNGKLIDIRNATKQMVMNALAGEYQQNGYRTGTSVKFDKQGNFKMVYVYDKKDEYSSLIGRTIPGDYYKRILSGKYTLYEANYKRFNNLGNKQPTNQYGEPIEDYLNVRFFIVLSGEDDHGNYHTMCGEVSQRIDSKYMYGWTISYINRVQNPDCICPCETGNSENREVTIPRIEIR